MDKLLAAPPTRGSALDDRVIVGAVVPETFTGADAESWLAAYDDSPGSVSASVDSGVLLVEHSGLPSGDAADWLRTWQDRTRRVGA